MNRQDSFLLLQSLFTLLFINLFFPNTIYANADSLRQEKHNINKKHLIQSVLFLLENKHDSAKIESSYIDTTVYLEADSNWFTKIKAIQRIAENGPLDYSDQLKLIDFSGNRVEINPEKEVAYVNKYVSPPSNKDEINFDYVKFMWYHISTLRDQISIEDAAETNQKLKQYVAQFSDKSRDVKRAKGLVLNNDIVLALIQKNAPLGLKLCNEMDSIGQLTNDTFLIASSKYHMLDFLIAIGNLEGYILAGEESFKLAQTSADAASYLIPTASNLINAYLHKGGHDERVAFLLQTIEKYDNAKHMTYYLYAQYIKTLSEDSPIRKRIFEKFNANNLIEFAHNLSQKAERDLRNKNLIDFYNQLSQAMLNFDHPDIAYRYMQRVTKINEKIYSEDLSKSIAQVETEYAVKSKDAEIALEKERKQNSMYLAAISSLLFLIGLFVIFRVRKQNKLLAQKNTEIAEQRDNIAKSEQEKAMLLKEVHHRVKNNFQIISSLLELQTKGIEDEKALELAQEGKNRVQSMALIHQRLYQNDDLLIYFDEYINKLVQELVSMYGAKNEIKTSLNAKNLSFDIDTAIPLGLIINELVTNAIKYGFTQDQKQLDISINKKDKELYELVVKDNGLGLPTEIDLNKAKSLGLRLVRRLAKQLHGKLSYSNTEGCTFTVTFKDTITRSLVD